MAILRLFSNFLHKCQCRPQRTNNYDLKDVTSHPETESDAVFSPTARFGTLSNFVKSDEKTRLLHLVIYQSNCLFFITDHK